MLKHFCFVLFCFFGAITITLRGQLFLHMYLFAFYFKGKIILGIW